MTTSLPPGHQFPTVSHARQQLVTEGIDIALLHRPQLPQPDLPELPPFTDGVGFLTSMDM